jgi:polysaccharide export outer membrane protein
MRTAIFMGLCLVFSLGAQQPATDPGSNQQPKASDTQKKSDGASDASANTTADPKATPATAASGENAAGTTPVSPKTYIIGAEDILHIIVWNNAGLTGDFMVRPDGAVSIPLIGDVQVAGRTPQETESLITQRLKEGKLMLDPHVSVGLAKVNSKKYYINGGVNRPGAYDLVVPLTIMEALVNAGGFHEFANTKKIRILRGKQEFRFNFNEVSHAKHLEQNIYLEPGDIIIVPE